MSNCSTATPASFSSLAAIDRSPSGPFSITLNGTKTTHVCGFNPYILTAVSNITSCCTTPLHNITSPTTALSDPTSCGIVCLAYCGYSMIPTQPLGFTDCLFDAGAAPPAGWSAQCFTVNSPGDMKGTCASDSGSGIGSTTTATTTKSANSIATVVSNSSSTRTSAGLKSSATPSTSLSQIASQQTQDPSGARRKSASWEFKALLLVNACFFILG